VLRRCV